MADMSKRHYRLIQDGIVDGVDQFLRQADCDADDYQSRNNVRKLTMDIANKVATKLCYTNDNFETEDFMKPVRQRVEELIKRERMK